MIIKKNSCNGLSLQELFCYRIHLYIRENSRSS